jgi:long-chain acyl-CoA synthetase
MYMYMLAHPDLQGFDLSTLSRCTVGGQTMPAAKMREVERRFGCPLIELWGMTEIAGLGTTFPSYGPHTCGSIGFAVPHCQVKIASVWSRFLSVTRATRKKILADSGSFRTAGYFKEEDHDIRRSHPPSRPPNYQRPRYHRRWWCDLVLDAQSLNRNQ